MNLNKAKKIAILVLAILNAVLFSLHYINKTDYTLSAAREKAVYEVLSKNNIALYTDLITHYEPMQKIAISPIQTDIDKILPVFFSDTSKINMTIEFSKTIYSDSVKSLTVSENYLLYENNEALGKDKHTTRSQASNTSDVFCEVMKAAMSFSPSLELEKITSHGSAYTFRYAESYNKHKIFCNYIEITVNNGIVTRAAASRYGINGFEGDVAAIAAPDEVMLTMLYAIKNMDLPYGIIITDMEIGYDFPDSSDIAAGDSIALVPCYRIYIQGMDEPFTVNAYTNELK